MTSFTAYHLPHHFTSSRYQWHHLPLFALNLYNYYNKKKITRWLELRWINMNFIFLWRKQYFTNERSDWVKYSLFSPLKDKIHIFTPLCNILSIYTYIQVNMTICFTGIYVIVVLFLLTILLYCTSTMFYKLSCACLTRS